MGLSFAFYPLGDPAVRSQSFAMRKDFRYHRWRGELIMHAINFNYYHTLN